MNKPHLPQNTDGIRPLTHTFRSQPLTTETVNLAVKYLHETGATEADDTAFLFLRDNLLAKIYYLPVIISIPLV